MRQSTCSRLHVIKCTSQSGRENVLLYSRARNLCTERCKRVLRAFGALRCRLVCVCVCGVWCVCVCGGGGGYVCVHGVCARHPLRGVCVRGVCVHRVCAHGMCVHGVCARPILRTMKLSTVGGDSLHAEAPGE